MVTPKDFLHGFKRLIRQVTMRLRVKVNDDNNNNNNNNNNNSL